MPSRKVKTLDEFLRGIEEAVNGRKPGQGSASGLGLVREESGKESRARLDKYFGATASVELESSQRQDAPAQSRIEEAGEAGSAWSPEKSRLAEVQPAPIVETSSEAVYVAPASPTVEAEHDSPIVILGLVVDEYVREARGYLLDVRYEGRFGKAVALIYDVEKSRLVKWIDRTGHRPYFLTDASPEQLGELKPPVTGDESVVSIETVSKIHPITREKVKLTKVVVSDPLAVRRLRERVKGAGFKYWEADIKYHHNYVFDNQLVPGMLYAADREWRLEGVDESKASAMVEEVFKGEPREFKELAERWVPIFEQPPPDVPRVAVDIEVYSPSPDELPDQARAPYPIISIALVDNRGMKRVLLLKRTGVEVGDLDSVGAKVDVYEDETRMLLDALGEMMKYPVVLTFNGDNFDLPYLYNRLISLGVDPSLLPFDFKQDYVTFTSAIHVDLHKFFEIRALQVYAFGNKYRELSLDAIAEALLGKKKIKLDKPVSELKLEELAKYNLRDAELTLEFTTYSNNLVWNLIILMMRISKMGLEDVTRSQVSGWIRSLMNWEHRRVKYLIPSSEEIAVYGNIARSKAIIKDKKYKGAKVLQPPRGVFFNIYVLDFASLYPSIIKNWNLSYETVNNPYCEGEKIEIPEVGHTVCKSIPGLSSLIVGLLKDFRVKIYKRKAKDEGLSESERLWYDTVQAAMKVYVNASYGVFGNDKFPLYSLAVAESVTTIGRMILTATEEKAKELDLIILYGDTDSVFIWDPPREKIDELTRYIKDRFGLDLEKDKEFKIALFSGLKKNYIGITRDGSIVIKGMVGKKSNTPEFIKEEFHRAVEILAGLDKPEDVEAILEKLKTHVADIYKRLRMRAYTLDELAIRVMLSKDPKEYDKNTPQHVKAALLLKKNGVPVSRGSIISYVKTRDGLGVKPVRLAKLSDVDALKYTEYVGTVFEQLLLALGVNWNALGGSQLTELAYW